MASGVEKFFEKKRKQRQYLDEDRKFREYTESYERSSLPSRPQRPMTASARLEARRSPVSNKIVFVAIDFGTTNSGYAYAFKHDLNTQLNKIQTNHWMGIGHGQVNIKAPTCLLLYPDRKLHSFGFEAKEKYASLMDDGEHKDWYFFREFKMTLHQEKEITTNYPLKDENGKTLGALTVFALSIEALKNHFLDALQTRFLGMSEKDVTWVITVPAIWNDSAKKFMRIAAEKAGIARDSIDIALEPEAASIFCREFPFERDRKTQHGMEKFSPGTRYMILDCGGGTVDVTVHEVTEDNNLKELYKATGGNWGGAAVNKEFEKFISSIVGAEVFDDFRNTDKSEYFELLEEFENKKRVKSQESVEIITIRLPFTILDKLKRALAESQNERTRQIARMYGNKVAIHGDKLRLDAKLFQSFFTKVVWEITKHVGDLMTSLPRPVETILMVGGFSESKILQKSIKNSFEERCNIIVPVEASLCVMKGAVIYGHQPKVIVERRSRFTYGVAMTVPYIEGKYPERRKVVCDGKEWCDGVFDVHVTVDQTIKPDEAQATRTYYPMSTSDTFLPIYIFRSANRNPTFVDEMGCDYVGLFKVKREPGFGETTKKDAMKVRLIFGGTDIKLKAYLTDGSVQRATFALRE